MTKHCRPQLHNAIASMTCLSCTGSHVMVPKYAEPAPVSLRSCGLWALHVSRRHTRAARKRISGIRDIFVVADTCKSGFYLGLWIWASTLIRKHIYTSIYQIHKPRPYPKPMTRNSVRQELGSTLPAYSTSWPAVLAAMCANSQRIAQTPGIKKNPAVVQPQRIRSPP